MNRDRGVEWLYGELPRLEREGVVGTETSEALRAHYGPVSPQSRRSLAIILFAGVGALFVGAGVILLLAANWGAMGRPLRTGISMGLLVAAQAVAGWVVYAKRDSVAWREGSGTALFAAVGACMALISQTYHLEGNLDAFLLTWLLLCLPTVYLLNASLPAVLCLVWMTWWAGLAQGAIGNALWFWPMAAGLAPHFIYWARKDARGPRVHFLSWSAALCFAVAIGIAIEGTLTGIWIPIYMSYFAVLYLAAAYWLGDGVSGPAPFRVMGSVGISLLSFALTFDELWPDIGWRQYGAASGYDEWAGVVDCLIGAGLLVASLVLLVQAVRRRQAERIFFGAAPIVTIAAYGSAAAGQAWAALALFNGYLFVLGVSTVVVGVRGLRLGLVNLGMAILTALILTRFMDSELGFTVRGLAFIAAGIGFLSVNMVLVRRRSAAA